MANFTPDMSGYSNVKPFRYWVQTVIPLVYDDSLSYMELLARVIGYLNMVIEDNKSMINNIEGLSEAYNQLQDYVNNYFENLDVQDEIDAKLDEMARSGALDILINPYIVNAVNNWLEENITPTTPIIDRTLEISGAGADSKTVGEYVKPMVEHSYNLLGVNYINADIRNGAIFPFETGNNNFALEDFIPIPDDVTQITLSGSANRGNTTVYIHEYTADNESSETNYTSKKVNNFPQTITLNSTTKFVRINGYLDGGSYITAIPKDFMLVYGNVNKSFVLPYVLSDEFATNYSKNYVKITPKLTNTHSTRCEYSTLYVCTPINEKILLTDEMVIFAPRNLRIAYQVFDGQFDYKADKIYDSGWKYSPIVIPNTYAGKYIMLVCSFNPPTDITPDIANSMEVYVKVNNTGIVGIDNTNVRSEFNNNVITNDTNVYKSIAHRGLQKISPECTAISYINAKKAGFRFAENDLFISSDGVYVMWHDPTLNKLGNLVSVEGYQLFLEELTDYVVFYDVDADTYYRLVNGEYVDYSPVNNINRMAGNSYSVSDLPYEILYKIDFGRYKGGEYIGTHILSFDEFVKLCRNLGMYIYLDRKITYTESILEDVADILNKYGMQNKTYIIGGFTPTTVQTLFEKLPHIASFISLAMPTQENITNFENNGCTKDNLIFMPDGKGIVSGDENTIKNANARGYETQMYYVDYNLNKNTLIETLYNLTLFGINGITTDNFTFEEIVKNYI